MGFLNPLPPLSQNFLTKNFLLYKGVTKSQTPLPLNCGHHIWMTPYFTFIFLFSFRLHEGDFMFVYVKRNDGYANRCKALPNMFSHVSEDCWFKSIFIHFFHLYLSPFRLSSSSSLFFIPSLLFFYCIRHYSHTLISTMNFIPFILYTKTISIPTLWKRMEELMVRERKVM